MTCLAAQTSSGTSMSTRYLFQGNRGPLPKRARVAHAASEIDVAA
jgi:hypothetical protein